MVLYESISLACERLNWVHIEPSQRKNICTCSLQGRAERADGLAQPRQGKRLSGMETDACAVWGFVGETAESQHMPKTRVLALVSTTLESPWV